MSTKYEKDQKKINDILDKTERQYERMQRFAMKGATFEYEAESRWEAVLALRTAVAALIKAN